MPSSHQGVNSVGTQFVESTHIQIHALHCRQTVARHIHNMNVSTLYRLASLLYVQAGSLSREVFPTQPGQLTKKPVVLLTNSSTASASEVLAGALHGNHRYTPSEVWVQPDCMPCDQDRPWSRT